MALKYDKFNFFWAVVAEIRLVKCFRQRDRTFNARILDEKSAFSSATVVFEK